MHRGARVSVLYVLWVEPSFDPLPALQTELNSAPKSQKRTQIPPCLQANAVSLVDITANAPIASFFDARSVARMALTSTDVKRALRGAPIDLRNTVMAPSELRVYISSGPWRLVGVTLICRGAAG